MLGRQQQGMDKPGVQKVLEGSGEQGKMERTFCKIIFGAPTTLMVKGLMMIMMMIPPFNKTRLDDWRFTICSALSAGHLLNTEQ